MWNLLKVLLGPLTHDATFVMLKMIKEVHLKLSPLTMEGRTKRMKNRKRKDRRKERRRRKK